MAGNTSLHCGKRVRLPMSTYSFMPVFSEERMVPLPMDWSTMQISPRAMSSREALLLALPKRLAVASIGKPGKGWALISPSSRLILVMSPCMASAETCLISSVLSNIRDKPCNVPPPIPIPPMCSMRSPSHCTSDVPVPILTTIIRSISVS